MVDLEAHPMVYHKQDLLAGLATELTIEFLYRSLRRPTCPPPVHQMALSQTPSSPVVACEDIFTFNNQSRPVGCHFWDTSQSDAPIVTLLPTPTTDNLPTPAVTKSSAQQPPQGFYSSSEFASLAFGWIGSLLLVQAFINMPIMLDSPRLCLDYFGACWG
ncbi:hypothetical protein BS50DRAFT_40376 [Corynespora cassiicola Philippines]|uniref:Uncharacterized protein n=1 Tax=Corynespora cassiicola Philippines TaxID=1448308 RepID=A0A2T2PCQ9_CORCC|nr:hypothetical protein BS50DRAFT_40376 [Corynespora cassiicola Philippines]